MKMFKVTIRFDGGESSSTYGEVSQEGLNRMIKSLRNKKVEVLEGSNGQVAIDFSKVISIIAQEEEEDGRDIKDFNCLP